MRQSIISTILLLSLFSVPAVQANELTLRPDSPNRYVVVPGDTLWDISSKFLRDAWRWPEIWGMNKDEVRNPHKIYPGDVILLEDTPDGKRLRIAGEKETVKLTPKNSHAYNATKLSPRIRVQQSGLGAIPSIPAAAIEPFLSQPLVIEEDGLEHAPYLLGSSDNRVILSTGDRVYARGMDAKEGPAWQIFRPGHPLHDPDQGDRILGYEATYLGNAKVTNFDDVSTIRITRSVEEILKGDRLIPSAGIIFNNYAPHAPEKPINGRIISVYGGVKELGKGSIVALNKGLEDGIEMGHVLAVFRRSYAKSLEGEIVQLPDERTGLVFIFRVFNKIAYALVMQSTQSIQVTDAVKSPN